MRRYQATTAIWLLLLSSPNCERSPEPASPQAKVDVTFEPAPPAVGTSNVTVRISDANGRPLGVTNLQVEGNMNHAGMRPSFAKVKEQEPGKFTGTIEFTMGGDWYLLVSGDLPGGTRLEEKIDVPGVRSR